MERTPPQISLPQARPASGLSRSRIAACAAALLTLIASAASAQVTLDPIEEGELGAEQQILNSLFRANSGIAVDSESEVFRGQVGNAELCPQTAIYTDFDMVPVANSTPAGSPQITQPDGVLFTSGCANLALMNTSGSFAGFIPNGSGDPDLEALSGTNVNDVNTFSFDFTVTQTGADAVRATFVFGSEEFPDQGVTDIFGFFVDGENYARFPDGSLVNFTAGANAGNFNDNNAANAGDISPYLIEHDGLSNSLTICAPLDPETSTHTLKIGIADTNDTAFDSGVFIGDLRAGLQSDSCGAIEIDTGISVDPSSAEAGLGQTVTLTATVLVDGEPDDNAVVTFEVLSGPNAGTSADVSTDANGQASFELTSSEAGEDIVAVSFVGSEGGGSAPNVSIVWDAPLGRFEVNGWGEALQRYTGGFGLEVGLDVDSDDVIFFAVQTDGVYILDVSDPSDIREIGRYDPETCDANGVEVPFFADDVIFVAEDFFIEPPDPIGGGIDESVQVMHVAAAECGVHIVGLADLENQSPQFLSSYGSGVGSAEAVEVYVRDDVSGDPCSDQSRAVAIVAATDSLDTYDWSDPQNPLACGSIPSSDPAFDDHLVVALDQFESDPPDEGDPGLPQLVNYAAVATGDGARLALVEDPSAPEILGGYLTPESFSPYLISQHIRVDPDNMFALLSSWVAGFQLITVDEITEEAVLLHREPTQSAVFGSDLCGFFEELVCFADGQMGLAILSAEETTGGGEFTRTAELPVGPPGAFAWDVEADQCTVITSYGVFDGGLCQGGSDDGDPCTASNQCGGAGECVFPGGLEIREIPDCSVEAFGEEPPADSDSDGVVDAADNCVALPNDQSDADLDGYGDACDADLSNDGVIGVPDFKLLIGAIGQGDGAADLSGDGVVGVPDFVLLIDSIGGTPGPSGLLCAGSVPCP